jgi:hypothetical protein
MTWTYVSSKSVKTDYFQDEVGTKESCYEEGKEPPIKVLRGYTYRNLEGDILRAFLKLYPGDINADVLKLNSVLSAAMQKPTTVGEFLNYVGLIIAARSQNIKGRNLFVAPKERSLFKQYPEFSRIMTRHRFEELKKHCTAICMDDDSAATDPWYKFRRFVEAFNENRRRTVITSKSIVIDESMSAFRPRTTPRGGLPNISYVKRKPKPMGTEFKCAADGRHGLMLFLEIQEGKDAMRRAQFRNEMGAGAACAMRVGLGAVGQRLEGAGEENIVSL